MRKLISITVIMMLVLMAGTAMAAGPDLTGKVIETMDSGGYTYIHLEGKSGKNWFAIPQAKVKKGDTVTVQPGMPMQNFTSKSLGKTFDVIYFAGGLAK